MKRVLITGMSGTGKSTVIAALEELGHRAVDADEPDFSELVSVPEGELTGLGSGADWVWREDRIDAFLATQDAETLFVSGTSPNQGKFYARFDVVVLPTAPPALIAQRLATRTNNNFGKDPNQLARTLRLQQEVEPLLRRGADMEVDTTDPLDEVVATILPRPTFRRPLSTVRRSHAHAFRHRPLYAGTRRPKQHDALDGEWTKAGVRAAAVLSPGPVPSA